MPAQTPTLTIRRWRKWHPHPSGDLLYSGHQPFPHVCRRLGQLSIWFWTTTRQTTSAPPAPTTVRSPWATSVTTCGDITVFKIDQTTGRLSLVVNAQVTATTSGQPITYFPVPANPVDFVLGGGGIVLTLGSTASANLFPLYGWQLRLSVHLRQLHGTVDVEPEHAFSPWQFSRARPL